MREEVNMTLSNKELSLVVGGLSGALLNSILGIAESIFELGRTIGRNLKKLFS